MAMQLFCIQDCMINEKEISKGDIITFDLFGNGEKQKAKVVFYEGSFWSRTDFIPSLDGTHLGHAEFTN